MGMSSSMRGRRAPFVRALAILLVCVVVSPLWAAPGDLTTARYTSNKPAGRPAFAYVELEWIANPSCASTMSVGEVRDERLGVSRGAHRLSKIRAVAHDPGAPSAVRHTREITLTYDTAAASCTAQHGPINLLTSIQESAWGDTEPRVDLPAVTFEYNRLTRTFDESVTQSLGSLGFGFDEFPQEANNLGWGIRQPGAAWPTVEAMMLDFDGDGLQDRLHMVTGPSASACIFKWQKNLGRQPNGTVQFSADRGPVSLPRLPWSGQDDTKGPSDMCSLSAQLTFFANQLPPQGSSCTVNSGSYLAYRWLDLNGDALPDLVAAIHHDPAFLDPAALTTFGAWPNCSSGPSCVLPDAACVQQTVTSCNGFSGGGHCAFDQSGLAQCIDSAARTSCGDLAGFSSKTNTFDPSCYERCMADVYPQIFCSEFEGECETRCHERCAIDDSVHPDSRHVDCTDKAEFQFAEPCGQYPWMVYDNLGGGQLATTPRMLLQPLPLETESGDSAFGGRGVASTQHAIEDLDGDGDLDALVLGRRNLTPPGGTPPPVLWWEVFLGDGTGAFRPVPTTDVPYFWFAPPNAPVSVSCTAPSGATCVPITGAHQTDDFDVRGLSLVSDLTGDGAADLIWKVPTSQFTSPPAAGRWQSVGDIDPITLFPSDGMGFLMDGTPSSPAGWALNPAPTTIDYLSRSHVTTAALLAPTPFMTIGARRAMSRLIDFDDDGRPDLLGTRFVNGAWESTARLQINGGGAFLVTAPLGSAINARAAQEAAAFETQYPAPRAYGWSSKKDLADLDGDGLPEGWQFSDEPSAPGQPGSCTAQSPCTATAYRDSDRQPLRLLKAIGNGHGGRVTITYAPTTDGIVVEQHADQRKAMPHPTWVVASTSSGDAWDPSDDATTRYHYKDPAWKPDDEGRWGFRGFEQITTALPSGARQVDEYGFDVDWSGRLKSSKQYESEADRVAGRPSTMRETLWSQLPLFGGAIKTFHPAAEYSWTCGRDHTETMCRTADEGRTTVWPLWTAVGGQLWLSMGEYRMDGPAYTAGDRRTVEVFHLASDATNYRLKQVTHYAFESVDGVPANDAWADFKTLEYDADYRHLIFDHQYLGGASGPDLLDRADTRYWYDEVGNKTAERRPRHQSTGLDRLFGYDPTGRFMVSTTNEKQQVATAEYEPGTGATVRQEGVNRVACGAGCWNVETAWTDVDGLGRPIATYVNHDTGAPVWVKTQVSHTEYWDAVVQDARPHVVVERLIDYGGVPRWTREETRFDGQGRPVEIRVKTGASSPDAVTAYDYDLRGALVSVTLPDGKAETRAQNSGIAGDLEAEGYEVTGGGGRMPEERIAGPGGGAKGSTYVDVTATNPTTGDTVRVQTVDTRAGGAPTRREMRAAGRILKKHPDGVVLVPKKRK